MPLYEELADKVSDPSEQPGSVVFICRDKVAQSGLKMWDKLLSVFEDFVSRSNSKAIDEVHQRREHALVESFELCLPLLQHGVFVSHHFAPINV
ncbi:hypothetical protein J2W88_002796 [Acidovorax delafieldii]|uniref:Uncharacterized protein n=1 Tax=Acidovorax delafieldii TaxID=47920 RepID=A0AAJ2BZX9_ACIDE|nr:hypothetical protein [Acidovorax delafieldii]MDR6767515.1 hypothetical protein [Acidovorax delafieldii]MDR6838737.1 hypothetical protein [Acidovorax delafieldii]MDR7368602.1 hypothetical protein [Acidovorax delafieldii]